MIKVKSKSDVITNSSSEVFCFRIDQDFEKFGKWLKKEKNLDVNKVFCVFRTLDDVKKLVTGENYFGWEEEFYEWTQGTPKERVEPVADIYGMDMKERLEKYKNTSGLSWDEIWERFKYLYEPVLGVAMAKLNNNKSEGPTDEIEAVYEYLSILREEKRKKYLERFEPGSVLKAEWENKVDKEMYGEEFMITIFYIGKRGIPVLAYNPIWKRFDEDGCEAVGRYKNGFNLEKDMSSFYFWRCKDHRPVSEEEKTKFLKAAEEAGFTED